MKQTFVSPAFVLVSGQIYDLPTEQALSFLQAGAATPIPIEEAKETATIKRKKKETR